MGRGGAGALFSAIHRDEVLLLFTMEEGKGPITHQRYLQCYGMRQSGKAVVDTKYSSSKEDVRLIYLPSNVPLAGFWSK